MKIFLSMFPLSLLLVACQVKSENQSRTIKPGEQFTITLSSNAGTGYLWIWSNEQEMPFLKLNKSTTPQTSRPGGPLTEAFTFTAQSTGSGTIRLEYKRPWEQDKPSEKTHLESVTVK